MRDILLEEHPDAVVSISCEMLREYRSTSARYSAVDASVKPNVSRYVTNISERLWDFIGHSRDDVSVTEMPFYVMKSNGGVRPTRSSTSRSRRCCRARRPAWAAMIAKHAGFPVLNDGGGTSADVSVVLDGEPTDHRGVGGVIRPRSR